MPEKPAFRPCVPLLAAALSISSASSAAERPLPATSRIESIALFKNGLAVVSRVVDLPGPGDYLLEDLPVPVHGTWWIESELPVDTLATLRETTVPADETSRLDLQRDLAGLRVTVHLAGEGAPALQGTVLDLPAGATIRDWSRDYEPERRGSWWGGAVPAVTPAGPDPTYLLLRTDGGRTYVRRDRIAYIEAAGARESVSLTRPALILRVGEGASRRGTARIHYLTQGIAWAPSYRVDLSDPRELVLRQKAVVKNELEDFAEAELSLISGFPSIEFGHVASPLSPLSSWAEFFRELRRTAGPEAASASNVVMTQAVGFPVPSGADSIDLSAVPAGEGPDLHYRSIGRRSMAEGDALAVDLAAATAEYRRVVEWTIPEVRDEDGRPVDEYRRSQDPERYRENAWDAVRFRNPFDFPMTTGPATVVAHGKFLGQRTSYWANRGEEASLRITRALSVRTRHEEREEPGERTLITLGGRDYRKVRVSGTAVASNHREESVLLVVRRSFSGNLLEATGEPRTRLLESGVYAINPRNELTWETELAPGEQRELEYAYEVLVPR